MISCNLCQSCKGQFLFEKSGYRLVKCASCSLVYVENPPSEENLLKYYSFSAGYKVGLVNDPIQIRRHTKVARRYCTILNGLASSTNKLRKLLDIGCAAGLFMSEARKCGWDVWGLEISEDLARVARSMRNHKVATWENGADNFKPNTFDAITLWDVIEHMRNPMGIMKWVFQLLREGGILLLTTPNIDGLFPRLSYLATKITGYWPHPEPPWHLFQFSKNTIYALLAKAGFEVTKIFGDRIPISYTFGGRGDTIPSQYRIPYTIFFVLIAYIAPLLHMGDSLIVIARKPITEEKSSTNDFVNQKVHTERVT